MNDLISVIIPANNVGNYIETCLKSVTSQTHKNLEIILIDDGSTDDTSSIADSWASKDKRIKVIHNHPSAGISLVRNAGINIAKGDYIGFIDSDDFIHPQFFERMLSLIKENDADVSLCREIAFNDGEKEPDFTNELVGPIHVEDHNQYISHFMDTFTGPIGWSWNKLFKASLLKNIRYKNFLYEDLVMNAEFSSFVHKAVWTDDRMYAYRIRLGSTTAAGTKNLALDEAQSFLATEQFFSLEPAAFRKRYHTYILGKIANIYANTRTKFGVKASKASFELFKKEYGNSKNSISLKLFLARYLPMLYCRAASKY